MLEFCSHVLLCVVHLCIIDSERGWRRRGERILARDLLEVLLASESRESQSIRIRRRYMITIIMTISDLRSMGQTSLSTSFLLR